MRKPNKNFKFSEENQQSARRAFERVREHADACDRTRKNGQRSNQMIVERKKGHRKENSTIKPEIPADENQQRIKNASAMNTSKKSSNEPDQEAERLTI
ncbi:hypothetical protein, partial [Eubacterium callanderi]|uniref:hypothetical protein n=1 Tax=Eubacterium callanderi TaxID=53442 RepID=UPI00391C7184